MVGHFKALFAASNKLLSSLILALLTLSLSFAGAILPTQLAMAGTMANAEWAGWIGGSGGSHTFDVNCDASSVVTGIRSATSGNSVFLGAECTSITSLGELGTVTRNSGSGGVFYDCPAGTAAVGLWVNYSSPQNVGIRCQSPPNKLDVVQEVGPTGNHTQAPTCANNGFVNRLYGHSGAWFDGFLVGCVTLSGYPSAVVASTNSAPTGTLTVGATLTSASTFQGLPTPTVAYRWERATSSSGPWEQISGANASTYQTVLADAGYLIRLVATGTNTTNSITNTAVSTSPATAAIGLVALSAPDLKTASDSGTSGTDNLTNDVTPSIDISGITTGATVTVTAVKAG
ncbi:MAG: hypothetical protein RL101_284, partial [Actinomycetota bacterium]